MIKNYLLDLVCVLLIGFIAFLVAERPNTKTHQSSKAGLSGEGISKKELEEKKEIGVQRYSTVTKALMERNIFNLEGKYPVPKTISSTISSERSYILIGILRGEENKALFKDPTGSIIALPVGKKLDDGFVITRIDTHSVELMKGDKRKILKIFEFKSPKSLSVKKP